MVWTLCVPNLEFQLVNQGEPEEEGNEQTHQSRQKSASSSLRSTRTKQQYRSDSHATFHTTRTNMNSEL